jgi:peptidoglycan/xylan/chitin deacetylase (PgdA/CDA1 family)
VTSDIIKPASDGAVLAYHEVMPESSYAYCVPCEALKQQLHLVQGHTSGLGTDFGVHVTFDDGEQSQYRHAFPLLAQYNIAATFFVTPGLIGSVAKLLGWNQLKDLQNAGHSIQSHGWSHKFLTFCGQQELAYELRASRERLEDRLGRAVNALSAPGGRWNRRVVEASAVAGYLQLYVSDPWLAAQMSGVRILGRFMVRRTTTLAELTRILQRDPRTLWNLKMRSEIKQRLVDLIGDGRYHRWWCRLTGYAEFEEARQNTYSLPGK